jgi:hypothetical protein
LGVSESKNKNTFLEILDKSTFHGGFTNIPGALHTARDYVQRRGVRDDIEKIVVVLSDGRPEAPRFNKKAMRSKTINSANALRKLNKKNLDVEIQAVGVGKRYFQGGRGLLRRISTLKVFFINEPWPSYFNEWIKPICAIYTQDEEPDERNCCDVINRKRTCKKSKLCRWSGGTCSLKPNQQC